jgi:tetratricopeptide (TPR) repeat protein
MQSPSRGKLLRAEVKALQKKKFILSKQSHDRKIAETMTQCANAFRGERNFVAAGKMYMRAARLYQELNDFPSATRNATDSANMFAKDPTQHTQTMDSLHFAIDIFKSRDKSMEAADLLTSLAKILVEEDSLKGAIESLQEANALFKEARADSRAATVLESVAEILAEKCEYVESARFLREVAQIRLGNQLTQTGSGAIFFKAILVQLETNDVVGARTELDLYLGLNPTFRQSHYYRFLTDILKKIEQRDIEGFDDAVDLFRRQNPVDQWVSNRLIDLRKYADAEGDAGLL